MGAARMENKRAPMSVLKADPNYHRKWSLRLQGIWALLAVLTGIGVARDVPPDTHIFFALAGGLALFWTLRLASQATKASDVQDLLVLGMLGSFATGAALHTAASQQLTVICLLWGLALFIRLWGVSANEPAAQMSEGITGQWAFALAWILFSTTIAALWWPKTTTGMVHIPLANRPIGPWGAAPACIGALIVSVGLKRLRGGARHGRLRTVAGLAGSFAVGALGGLFIDEDVSYRWALGGIMTVSYAIPFVLMRLEHTLRYPLGASVIGGVLVALAAAVWSRRDVEPIDQLKYGLLIEVWIGVSVGIGLVLLRKVLPSSAQQAVNRDQAEAS